MSLLSHNILGCLSTTSHGQAPRPAAAWWAWISPEWERAKDGQYAAGCARAQREARDEWRVAEEEDEEEATPSLYQQMLEAL